MSDISLTGELISEKCVEDGVYLEFMDLRSDDSLNPNPGKLSLCSVKFSPFFTCYDLIGERVKILITRNLEDVSMSSYYIYKIYMAGEDIIYEFRHSCSEGGNSNSVGIQQLRVPKSWNLTLKLRELISIEFALSK